MKGARSKMEEFAQNGRVPGNEVDHLGASRQGDNQFREPRVIARPLLPDLLGWGGLLGEKDQPFGGRTPARDLPARAEDVLDRVREIQLAGQHASRRRAEARKGARADRTRGKGDGDQQLEKLVAAEGLEQPERVSVL